MKFLNKMFAKNVLQFLKSVKMKNQSSHFIEGYSFVLKEDTWLLVTPVGSMEHVALLTV